MLNRFFRVRGVAKLHPIDVFEKRLDVACSLRLVGLACAILFAAVTAVAAQSETSSAPPIRLPGIAYPKPADAGVKVTIPKLKSKARSDRAPSARETTQGARVAPEGRITSTPTPGEHTPTPGEHSNVKLPGVAYPGASAIITVAPALGLKSTQPLEVPAAREPPSSIPMVPPEIPPPTSHGLMVAPRANKEGTSAPIATIMQQREAPKTEPTPEPQPAGNDGQQKPKTETADTATHATSVPEPGGAATLPNAKDAPAATTLVPREDFAPRVLRSNQQNTVSNVVVPDNVSEPFFDEGSSIIELLQAAAHKIPPEAVALQPALAMFLFAVPALLSLMYVIDREAAARAIARVLRPGGRLVGAVWEGPEQQADIELLQQTAGSFAPEPPVRGVGPDALGDPASFLAQLVDAGSKPHVETEIVEFTFDNFESAWDALATEAFRGDRLPGMVELDHRNPASATAAAG